MNLPTFTTLGTGHTVLMLHGIDGTHLAFAPQVESLAMAGYRAVAWDMPGYGLSMPVEPYNFKALAGRCIALIEALQCGGVTLLGHDIGGMVAQEVIARRPDLVSRLVLCSTFGAFDSGGTAAQQAFVAGRAALLESQVDMAALASHLLPRMIGPGSLPEGVRLAEHCLRQVHPATYRRALEACGHFDRTASLPHIHVPTLLLSGDHDQDAPSGHMRETARRIPGSTFIQLRGIGHLPHLEAPDDFDAALLNFLALPRILH